MLDKLAWSADGQLLTVSTQSGTVHTYLTKLPTVGAAAENRLAYLSSLQEMTVMLDDRTPPVKSRIKLSAEPTTMAVGPFHAACAINNTAWSVVWAERHASSLPLPQMRHSMFISSGLQ